MTKIKVVRTKAEDIGDRSLPYDYVAEGGYKINVIPSEKGWDIFVHHDPALTKVKEGNDDRIIEEYKGDTEIFTAYIDEKEAGIIQIENQDHNKSMRIWDIYVFEPNRRNGVGTALMNKAKERARSMGVRRIILETQSCNMPAMSFYQKHGFDLAGLDITNYTNDDIGMGEVRLELYFDCSFWNTGK